MSTPHASKRDRLDPHNIEVMESEMVPLMRAMPPEQKLAMAHQMFIAAREVVIDSVRCQYPDWADHQVQQEVLRRLHGDRTTDCLDRR